MNRTVLFCINITAINLILKPIVREAVDHHSFVAFNVLLNVYKHSFFYRLTSLSVLV